MENAALGSSILKEAGARKTQPLFVLADPNVFSVKPIPSSASSFFSFVSPAVPIEGVLYEGCEYGNWTKSVRCGLDLISESWQMSNQTSYFRRQFLNSS